MGAGVSLASSSIETAFVHDARAQQGYGFDICSCIASERSVSRHPHGAVELGLWTITAFAAQRYP